MVLSCVGGSESWDQNNKLCELDQKKNNLLDLKVPFKTKIAKVSRGTKTWIYGLLEWPPLA
jgi:hypothetical protein